MIKCPFRPDENPNCLKDFCMFWDIDSCGISNSLKAVARIEDILIERLETQKPS